MIPIHYALRSNAVTQTLTGSLDPSSAIPVETKHCGNINGQMGEDQVSRFLFKSVFVGGSRLARCYHKGVENFKKINRLLYSLGLIVTFLYFYVNPVKHKLSS